MESFGSHICSKNQTTLRSCSLLAIHGQADQPANLWNDLSFLNLHKSFTPHATADYSQATHSTRDIYQTNWLHSLAPSMEPMLMIRIHQWHFPGTKIAKRKTHLLRTASQTHIQNWRAQVRRTHETNRRRVRPTNHHNNIAGFELDQFLLKSIL